MSDEQDPRDADLPADRQAVDDVEADTDVDHSDETAQEADVEDVGGQAAEDAEAHDAELDAEVDRLDDGGALVGAARGVRSEALPFMMSTREHFAALDGIEPTGDARVDAATARLDEVPDLPTSDHVEVYDDVLRRLQDALSDADVR